MKAIENFFQTLHQVAATSQSIPKKEAEALADCLVDSLFPIRAEKFCEDHQFESLYKKLQLLLKRLNIRHTDNVCISFFEALPRVHEALQQDAEALFRFDPAAESKEEVVLSYPGFYAVAVYRLAHELHRLKVPILPRIWAEHAHSKTGIDLHPAAQIAAPFFIDHGTGIVIGATCIIGKNVRIYQGVTLGALSVKKEFATVKRHPTIEDNVVIYANATILGGNTIIGHDSMIGGNVWLTESIAPYSVVQHRSEIHIRSHLKTYEPFDWVI